LDEASNLDRDVLSRVRSRREESSEAVLEGLDSINWGQLRHAYGEASDVPDLLRALADGDEEAWSDLYANLWHQGTVYQATAYAVPFLREILTLPQSDKVGLMVYLEALAKGNSYIEVHHDLEEPDNVNQPEYQQRWKEELHWVAQTRSEVIKGLALYVGFLQHGSPEERSAAALLLSGLLPDQLQLTQVLQTQLSIEPDGSVQAALLLSFLTHPQPEAVRETLEPYLDSSDALLRFAAAQSLTHTQKSLTPAKALSVLLESLLLTTDLGDRLAVLPRNFSSDELVREAAETLEQAASVAIPYLLEALKRLDPQVKYYSYYIEDIARSLFAVAFGEETPLRFTSLQLEVLQALKPFRAIFDDQPHNFSALLSALNSDQQKP
jgi:hypothetical protein